MSILAIDAGPTGVTAIAVSAEGAIVARGYQEFAQHFPRPGWVEHAPEAIWQTPIEATRQALASSDGALPALGINNQPTKSIPWPPQPHASPPPPLLSHHPPPPDPP